MKTKTGMLVAILAGLLVLAGSRATRAEEGAGASQQTEVSLAGSCDQCAEANDEAGAAPACEEAAPAALSRLSDPGVDHAAPVRPALADVACADLGECACITSLKCKPLTEACYCPFPQCGEGMCLCGGGKYLGCGQK